MNYYLTNISLYNQKTLEIQKHNKNQIYKITNNNNKI